MPETATPQNAGYLVAAYTVAAVILLAYVGWLWARARRALDAARR